MATKAKDRAIALTRTAAGRATPRAASRLGHTATIDYRGERGDLLSKALNLLTIQADRLEARGGDVTATRDFVRSATKEAWPVAGVDA